MLEYYRIYISEGKCIKNIIFVIIGILEILVLNTNHILQYYHGLMQKAIHFNSYLVYEQKWCNKYNEIF